MKKRYIILGIISIVIIGLVIIRQINLSKHSDTASVSDSYQSTASTVTPPSSFTNYDTSRSDEKEESAPMIQTSGNIYIKGSSSGSLLETKSFSISEYGSSDKAEIAAHNYGLSSNGVYYLSEDRDLVGNISGYTCHTFDHSYDSRVNRN